MGPALSRVCTGMRICALGYTGVARRLAVFFRMRVACGGAFLSPADVQQRLTRAAERDTMQGQSRHRAETQTPRTTGRRTTDENTKP